jgi:type I restriction enzyme S subunit
MSRNQNSDPEPTPAALPRLPTGWCWTTLSAIADIEGGITKDQKRQRTATMREVPYLRVANVQRGYLDLEEMKTILAKAEEIESLRLEKGDVLFTEGGDRDKLGRGWVWNDEIEECIHQNHIFRARPCLPLVEPKFISFHGNFFGQDWFTRTGKQTTNLASINKGVLSRFPVPLAPLNEQRRIVAKIEELFSDLDAGVSALERVKANLKRYRAAVFQAAITGRLTETWRARHPDAEPASELLKRILAERRRKWEEEQLAKYAESNKEPPKRWQAMYRQPTVSDVSGHPELPQGWCWASFESLLSEPLRNGHSARAAGNGTGIRTLTLTAVTLGEFSEKNTKLTVAKPEDVEDLWLQPGDFLIERSNTAELVGTARLYRGPADFAVFPDLLIRARTLAPLVKSYIDVVLQSDATRTFFRRRAKGLAGNMPKIDQGTILGLPIPLPSLAEQAEIAEEVERRLSIIEEVEAQVEVNLKRAARLRQCILKRAFEGRLVPQDPTDEPADKLLERICQERTARNGDTETPKQPQSRRARRKPKAGYDADTPGGTD